MKWFKRRKKCYEVLVKVKHRDMLYNDMYIVLKRIVSATTVRKAYVLALSEMEIGKQFFCECMQVKRYK
ncbi:MAG TPA: hypothetical protein PLP27_12550 [Crocinitomicaceae bacterium]|nr:hypothetical protein [Crocinitomicaceae bacterium]